MVQIEVPEVASKMAYDRAIVVFSPEGRLYQVEYAFKAVENATTCVGVTFKDGVVLLAAKTTMKLLIPDSIEKIMKIDDHIGAGFCGLVADARVLIDYARIRAQINRVTYGEPIEIYAIAKEIADRKQRFTQVGGIRPFGVAFLIAGYDTKPHLFETDPSGSMRAWFAHAIGRGSKIARKVLEKGWKQGMNKDQAVVLASKALKAAEQKITFKEVEGGIVEDKRFRKFDRNEIKRIMR